MKRPLSLLSNCSSRKESPPCCAKIQETLEPIFQQLAVLWGEIPDDSIGAFLDALELLSRYNRALTEESQIPPSLIRIQ